MHATTNKLACVGGSRSQIVGLSASDTSFLYKDYSNAILTLGHGVLTGYMMYCMPWKLFMFSQRVNELEDYLLSVKIIWATVVTLAVYTFSCL